MSNAAERLATVDLDALWSRNEAPDLELDAETGRLTSVGVAPAATPREPRKAERSGARFAIADAASIVLDAVPRWD